MPKTDRILTTIQNHSICIDALIYITIVTYNSTSPDK